MQELFLGIIRPLERMGKRKRKRKRERDEPTLPVGVPEGNSMKKLPSLGLADCDGSLIYLQQSRLCRNKINLIPVGWQILSRCLRCFFATKSLSRGMLYGHKRPLSIRMHGSSQSTFPSPSDFCSSHSTSGCRSKPTV